MGTFTKNLNALKEVGIARGNGRILDTSAHRGVPRVKFLMDLQGTYQAEPSFQYGYVPVLISLLLAHNGCSGRDKIQHAVINNIAPDGKQKLSKWLHKSNVPEKMISEMFNTAVCPGDKIEITCKFSDILRMSETKHFTSCLRNGAVQDYQHQRLVYMMDKYVCLIVIRDSKGDFKYRRVIGLVHGVGGRSETMAIRVNKGYGNGPRFESIKKVLESHTKLPCYLSAAENILADEYLYRPEPFPRYIRENTAGGWDDGLFDITTARYYISTNKEL